MDEKVVEKRQPTRERHARCCAFASAGEKKHRYEKAAKDGKKRRASYPAVRWSSSESEPKRAVVAGPECGYEAKSRAMNEMFLQLLFSAFAF